MAQSQGQIDKIVKQFPLVGRLLRQRSEEKAAVATLDVRVKKLDKAYLYSFPADYLGEVGIFSGDTLKGALKHYIYASIENQEKPFEVTDSNRDRNKEFTVRLLQIILRITRVKYLVDYQILSWFEAPTEGQRHDGVMYGSYLRTEVKITVYTIPQEGLAYAFASIDPRHNVTLNRAMVQFGCDLQDGTRLEFAWVKLEREKWIEVSTRLQKLEQLFQTNCFDSGLRQFVNETTTGKVTGTYEGMDIIVRSTRYVTGPPKLLVELKLGNLEAQLVGEKEDSQENRGHVYMYKYNGTLPQIEMLVKRLIDAWGEINSTKSYLHEVLKESTPA